MRDMGLSSRVQAVLVGVSVGLGAFGTAAAVIPDFVPPEYKVPIAVTAWLSDVVGFKSKKHWAGRRLTQKQKLERRVLRPLLKRPRKSKQTEFPAISLFFSVCFMGT